MSLFSGCFNVLLKDIQSENQKSTDDAKKEKVMAEYNQFLREREKLVLDRYRRLPFPMEDLLLQRKVYDKERTRRIEREISKYSESDGKYMERINNMNQSKDNFIEAVFPFARVFDFIRSYSLEDAKKNLQKGDHIKCNRTVYSHHGIYIGKGDVIAYDSFIVHPYTLEEFADGDFIVRVEDEKAAYSPDEIVERAWSRVGEIG